MKNLLLGKRVSLILKSFFLLGVIVFLAFQSTHPGQINGSVIQVPGDFTTITQAVEYAQPGQTIEVDAQSGPYEETFHVREKEIFLVSVNGQAEIIFPNQTRLGILFEGNHSKFEGFLIKGKTDQWIQFIGQNSTFNKNTIHSVNVLIAGKNSHVTNNQFTSGNSGSYPHTVPNGYNPVMDQLATKYFQLTEQLQHLQPLESE